MLENRQRSIQNRVHEWFKQHLCYNNSNKVHKVLFLTEVAHFITWFTDSSTPTLLIDERYTTHHMPVNDTLIVLTTVKTFLLILRIVPRIQDVLVGRQAGLRALAELDVDRTRGEGVKMTKKKIR